MPRNEFVEMVYRPFDAGGIGACFPMNPLEDCNVVDTKFVRFGAERLGLLQGLEIGSRCLYL